MNPASRQDVQNIVDNARNRIMERTVTRQDLIAISDMTRSLIALHQQSQQMLKQSEYQRSQLSRRLVAIEARMIAFENQMQALGTVVSRSAGQRPQQIIMPVQSQPDPHVLQQAAQYVAEYRPS